MSQHSSLCARSAPASPPLHKPLSPTSQPQALDCCEASQLSLAHGVRLPALHPKSPKVEAASRRLSPQKPLPTRHSHFSLPSRPPPNQPFKLLTSHFPPPLLTNPPTSVHIPAHRPRITPSVLSVLFALSVRPQPSSPASPTSHSHFSLRTSHFPPHTPTNPNGIASPKTAQRSSTRPPPAARQPAQKEPIRQRWPPNPT